MKKLYRILIAIVIFIPLCLTFFTIMERDQTGKNQFPIAPIPDKNRYILSLYFGSQQNNNLTREKRVIVSSQEDEEKLILRELIKGPRNKLLKPSIPEETQIISLKAVDGICYVNLSKDFLLHYDEEEIDRGVAIWSIVNSLTELEHIQGVQILVEGKKINRFGNEYTLVEPIYRNDQLLKKEVKTPIRTFKKFLSDLNQLNYQEAYETLDSSSKEKTDFLKFKLMMGSYKWEMKDYEIDRYNTQKYEKKVVLVITFNRKPTSLTDIPDEMTEQWTLVNEKDDWKIVLP